MGRPKKENTVLSDETVVETQETVEEVTAEVVNDDAAAQEIKKLKAELAEKDSQIKVISAGSQKRVRDKVKKIIPGGNKKSGVITIYKMK
jgi:hypothetical protein